MVLGLSGGGFQLGEVSQPEESVPGCAHGVAVAIGGVKLLARADAFVGVHGVSQCLVNGGGHVSGRTVQSVHPCCCVVATLATSLPHDPVTVNMHHRPGAHSLALSARLRKGGLLGSFGHCHAGVGHSRCWWGLPQAPKPYTLPQLHQCRDGFSRRLWFLHWLHWRCFRGTWCACSVVCVCGFTTASRWHL